VDVVSEGELSTGGPAFFPGDSARGGPVGSRRMSSDTALLGLRGCVIDAPEYGKLRTWRDGAVVIENGRIAEVGDFMFLGKKPRPQPIRWLYSPRAAIFPGLIDIHSHVPQYPVVARGKGQLLDWLHGYIFPKERTFTGPAGQREAAAFFPELARHGTTTAMLYGAIYEDSCDAAFAAAAKIGLRVILGKMMMDVGTYGTLQPRKVISVSMLESERLCKKWHGQNEGLLEYAMSPRFALACSERMMKEAAAMAKQFGCYVQTHLAENREECERVKHLFPTYQNYTEVYEKCGLLGPRTVVGHAIYLSDAERAVLAETGTAVAHCPTANFFLSSGIMPLAEHRAAGVKIGLGTDVAAGTELNLWQVMRSAIEGQKARHFYEPAVPIPTPAQVLHLATQGAAEALGKGRIIGSFDVGKEADVTVMDLTALLPYRGSAMKIEDLTPEDALNLCVYRGGPHAVLETFVRGRSVHRSAEPELF
jgi:guanine deaminase